MDRKKVEVEFVTIDSLVATAAAIEQAATSDTELYCAKAMADGADALLHAAEMIEQLRQMHADVTASTGKVVMLLKVSFNDDLDYGVVYHSPLKWDTKDQAANVVQATDAMAGLLTAAIRQEIVKQYELELNTQRDVIAKWKSRHESMAKEFKRYEQEAKRIELELRGDNETLSKKVTQLQVRLDRANNALRNVCSLPCTTAGCPKQQRTAAEADAAQRPSDAPASPPLNSIPVYTSPFVAPGTGMIWNGPVGPDGMPAAPSAVYVNSMEDPMKELKKAIENCQGPPKSQSRTFANNGPAYIRHPQTGQPIYPPGQSPAERK